METRTFGFDFFGNHESHLETLVGEFEYAAGDEIDDIDGHIISHWDCHAYTDVVVIRDIEGTVILNSAKAGTHYAERDGKNVACLYIVDSSYCIAQSELFGIYTQDGRVMVLDSGTLLSAELVNEAIMENFKYMRELEKTYSDEDEFNKFIKIFKENQAD